MTHRPHEIVVGLSANMISPLMHKPRPDGIGVYTLALERALPHAGVAVRRVYAPEVRSRGARWAPRGELAIRQPLASAIAAGALGLPTFGTRVVEAAIDVYHATDYLVPPLRRVPTVATIYDVVAHEHPEWATPRARAVKNWIRERGLARADLVITLTQAMVPEVEQHYRIPRERIRVVPLGVDEEWFEPVRDDVIAATLARFRLQPGYLLFVGTLQPRKNVGVLLRAYDRLPAHVRGERPLVLAGRYGWGEPELMRELQRRTRSGACRWLDYVAERELRALYAAAGAFVFPSLAEGFGLPMLEALAAGLPVIASDLAVLREVAGPVAIFASPNDPDAIAGAIEVALENTHAAQVAERRARARRFSWLDTAHGTAAIYRELCAGAR